jgi:hypothetical protein
MSKQSKKRRRVDGHTDAALQIAITAAASSARTTRSCSMPS